MMGVKDLFTPTKNYDNFSIEAVLKRDGKVIDTAKMTYDCQKINPAKCSDSSQNGS